MSGLTDTPDLVVEPLNRVEMRVLFPLVQMAEPDLDLPRWLAYATKLSRRRDGRAGILVARRVVRRFPCGVVCYRQYEDLRFGTVLMAEHMVAVDPIDPQSVLLALAEQLDITARQLGCTAVRVLIPDAKATVELRRVGHEGEGAVMIRALPPILHEPKRPPRKTAQLPR